MSQPDLIDVDALDSGPQAGEYQRDIVLSIPAPARGLLPLPSLSVSAFLSNDSVYAPIPRQSALPQRVVFSREICDPNAHAIVKALKTRSTFPPFSIVRSLQAQLDDAWRDGYRSIQDTYYGGYPLPMWALSFWSLLHTADRLRADWMVAEECIRDGKHRDPDPQLLIRGVEDEIRQLFHQVAWNEPILGFPALGWRPTLDPTPENLPATIKRRHSETPTNLAAEGSEQSCSKLFLQFFRTGFLNGEAINMMLHYLGSRVRRDATLANRIVVADLEFTNRLLAEYSNKSSDSVGRGSLLPRYATLFTKLGREVLYFVVNPGKDHWAGFKVDILNKSIAYGDSLAETRSMHKAAHSALIAWLKHVFGPSTKFTLGPNLPCDIQNDGFSCGIAICTTFSHSLGFDDPWSREKAHYMRITWARRAMGIHAQAKRPAILDSETDADSVPTCNDALEPSARSRRLALESLLNGPAPMETKDISNTNNLSVALEQNLTMDCDANSSSLSVLVFSDNDAESVADCNVYSSPNDTLSSPVLSVDDGGVLHLTESDEEPPASSKSQALSPMRALGKHRRSASDEAATAVVSTSSKRRVLSVVYEDSDRQSGPSGISRAAKADRAANEAHKNGTLIVSPEQRAAFLRRLREIDGSARLDPDDPGCKTVWHELCGSWITMDGPKRSKRYREHIQKCQGKLMLRKNGKFTKAASGSLRIDTIFNNAASRAPTQSATSYPSLANSASSLSPTPAPLIPCLGLRPEHDKHITHLIGRDPLGGRKSMVVLARGRFKKEFKSLTPDEQNIIRAVSNATARWQVHYDPKPYIRSSQCARECDPSMTEIEVGPTDICQPCADLLFMREFRNAMGRPPAPTENLKFTPKIHRNKQQAVLYGRYVGLEAVIEQADSKRTPIMNLVTKILTGELKNADVFLGLMEVMASKEDRLSRGKGLQGMTRSPALVSFCHAILISSPRAYRLLGKHLPVPSERSLKQHRSQQPSFPIGVTDENVKCAVRYLERLEYTGPVSISCDDTQLLSKFSPYFDSATNKWYLLGGVDDPIEIDDSVEGVEERIADAIEKSEPATKCRLWCLQIPMPGVPVFILAAAPISSTLKAEDLLVMHNRLINGLLDAGVCVVSYATDGSKTERKVSSRFLESASKTETTLIPHPRLGFPDIPIVLRFFGPHGTPLVAIQDVKHAMKTARNCIFNGTRLMTIGNCVIHYLQVLTLSVHPSSPLYQRDVSKVDRQDDRAAARLFSSAFLQHIVRISSNQHSGVPFKPAPLSIVSTDFPSPAIVLRHNLHGLLAFVFVFGDAFDAFQSRSLDIYERIVMIARLFFFLEIWKSSLKTLGYSEAEHFITRDLYDILCNLVHSFLSLVFIYRDKLDHPNYSLCGWLHSTEGAEHTFAEARKAQPDFDFAAFITMVPKLDIMSMAAVSTGDDDSDAKARASGYSHTLYSKLGIDVHAMSNFPSASLVHQAFRVANEEAEAIFSRLGIAVTDSLCPPPSESRVASGVVHAATEDDYTAPPISTWFEEEETPETWVDPAMACDFAEEPRRLAAELDELLEEETFRWGTTAEIDDQMAAYGAASMALNLEERLQVEAKGYRDDEENLKQVRRLMLQVFPPLGLRPLVEANQVNYESLVDTDTAPSDVFANLVALRTKHETLFTKKSVRVGHLLKPEAEATTATDSGTVGIKTDISTTSARVILLKKVHSTLKSIQDASGSTSGVARRARHEGRVETAKAGNSANAAEAAKARGNEALNTRIRAFNSAKLKVGALLGTAGVTPLAPIQTGSYAFVLVDKKIWFAEVLTMYSKGGGKAGKHGWANKQSNLASLSNLSVQLWEHWMENDFRSVPKQTAVHYAKCYAHVRSQRVLYVTSPNEKFEHRTDELVRLNASLSAIWRRLNKEREGIAVVVDNLLRRRRKGNDDDEDDD